MYTRDVICMCVVYNNGSYMKAKIQQSYKKLVGKHPIFAWTRLNRNKMKDFEGIKLNIPERNFISDPTYQ